MPSLSGQCNPAIGPLVQIGVDPPLGTTPFTPSRVIQPIPTAHLFSGLLDTGATTSCISAAVVAALGISAAGMRPMGSATQVSVATNTYLVDIALVFVGVNWWFPNLLAYEYVPSLNSGHQVLIGRDVICQGVFTLHTDGHFSFSI
jgi:hypothetical protein